MKKSLVLKTFLSLLPTMGFISIGLQFSETTNLIYGLSKKHNLQIVNHDLTINENLPSKYDPRNTKYEGPVKYQGSDPICWAYSMSSLIENNLLKNDVYPNIDYHNINEISISPYNLNYITYNRTANVDKVGLTSDFTESGNGMYGGSLNLTANALTQWSGPSFTKDMPTKESAEKFGVPVGYLNDYSRVENNLLNVNAVKELIYKYGGVAFSYNSSQLKTNPNTNYYNLKFSSTNHASIIVGWDDSISKSKFAGETPSQDGGWIVKNSWGTHNHEKGYYYASYDSNLESVTALNYGSSQDYQNTNYYYYDSSKDITYSDEKTTVKNEYAAIFPTLKATYNQKEYLREVAFYVDGVNTKVQIEIYKNVEKVNFGFPKSINTDPTNGELVCVNTADIEYSGLHFVKLSEEIELQANQNFSVVIKILDGKGTGIRTNHPAISLTQEYSTNDMTFYKDEKNNWVNLKYLNENVAKIRAVTYNKEDLQNSENSKNIEFASIKLNKKTYEYKQNEEFDFDVFIDDKKLVLNQDYQIKNVTADYGTRDLEFRKPPDIIGGGTVTIEGINNYFGTVSKNYSITMAEYPSFEDVGVLNLNPKYVEIVVNPNAKNYSDLKLSNNWKWAFPDKEIKFDVKEDNYITYINPNDKDLYFNNMFATLIKKSVDGTTTIIENYSPQSDFTTTPTPLSSSTPSVTPEVPPSQETKKNIDKVLINFVNEYQYYYTGKQITPEVVLTYKDDNDIDVNLIRNQDYQISYLNNIDVGAGTINIEGINNYYGIKQVSFDILIADSLIIDFQIENDKPIANSNFGEVKYRYTKNPEESINWYCEIPYEIGTWYVQAYIEGNNNYTSSYSDWKKIEIKNLENFNHPTNNSQNLDNNQLDIKVIIGICCGTLAIIVITVGITFAIVKYKKRFKRIKILK